MRERVCMGCFVSGYDCDHVGGGDSESEIYAEMPCVCVCVCVCVRRSVGVPVCVSRCIEGCCEALFWPQRERERPGNLSSALPLGLLATAPL